MKIKVVNIKDLGKYLAKICIIFGIVSIFAKFFYTNKNTNPCFSFKSNNYIKFLNTEIVSIGNINGNKSNKKSSILKKDTINNEFSLIKMVAAQNISNVNIEKNSNNNEIEQVENNVAQTNNEIVEPQTNVNIEVMPSNVADKCTYEVFGVQVRNESDYNISEEITNLDCNFNKQNILIFHTHTCESYTPTEQFNYTETGSYRTTDLNYTVARVGDELEKHLTNYRIFSCS